MRVQRGHVVLTRGQEHLYKVILEYEWGDHSEHPVDSIREGEALIRSRVCPPLKAEVEKLRRAPPDRLVDAAAPTPGLSLIDGDLLASLVCDDTPETASPTTKNSRSTR